MTKYRRQVLDHTILTDCENMLRATAATLDTDVVEFNGEADHVHLLVKYPPQVPTSEPTRRLNGASARQIRSDYTGSCNRARMHRHFWTPSYFAVSAGGTPPSVLKQYIENQERPP